MMFSKKDPSYEPNPLDAYIPPSETPKQSTKQETVNTEALQQRVDYQLALTEPHPLDPEY